MADIKLQLNLTDEEAWVWAQFLKRVRIDHYADVSSNAAETILMFNVGEKIRRELIDAGFDPQ